MNELLTANYISKETTELDRDLFKFSLLSTAQFCEKIVVVDNGNSEQVKKMLADFKSKIHQPYVNPKDYSVWDEGEVTALSNSICKDVTIIDHPQENESFAELRNLALAETTSSWVLWVDCDEVHFNAAKKLRDILLEQKLGVSSLTTSFYHFTLDFDKCFGIEPRVNIFKRDEKTHWEEKVHERVVGIPEGTVQFTTYRYHHYGYCKPQSEVFQHWYQYAKLAGEKEPYKYEETEGKIIPYFGEHRPGPEHILDDRKNSCVKYLGRYPEVIPSQWLKNKGVDTDA